MVSHTLEFMFSFINKSPEADSLDTQISDIACDRGFKNGITPPKLHRSKYALVDFKTII